MMALEGADATLSSYSRARLDVLHLYLVPGNMVPSMQCTMMTLLLLMHSLYTYILSTSQILSTTALRVVHIMVVWLDDFVPCCSYSTCSSRLALCDHAFAPI